MRHLGYYGAGVAGVGKLARRSGPGLVLVDSGTLLERGRVEKERRPSHPGQLDKRQSAEVLVPGSPAGFIVVG